MMRVHHQNQALLETKRRVGQKSSHRRQSGLFPLSIFQVQGNADKQGVSCFGPVVNIALPVRINKHIGDILHVPDFVFCLQADLVQGIVTNRGFIPGRRIKF